MSEFRNADWESLKERAQKNEKAAVSEIRRRIHAMSGEQLNEASSDPILAKYVDREHQQPLEKKADLELVTMFIMTRDEDAFRVLYIRHRKRLLGLIRSKLMKFLPQINVESLVDDILEIAWAAAYEKIPTRFKPTSGEKSFTYWINQITVNKCRDFSRPLRTKGRSPRTEFAQGGEATLPDRPDTASSGLPISFNSLEFQEALSSLTPEERIVLEKIAAGATNSEISKELGKSEETVRKLYNNAIAKMQRFFGDDLQRGAG